MYSVVVHTSDSNADYGANIGTTDKLKSFLCALDMQLVTHLEVNYYMELQGPVIPTPITSSIAVVDAHIPEAVNISTEVKPKEWEPDTMGLPL